MRREVRKYCDNDENERDDNKYLSVYCFHIKPLTRVYGAFWCLALNTTHKHGVYHNILL